VAPCPCTAPGVHSACKVPRGSLKALKAGGDKKIKDWRIKMHHIGYDFEPLAGDDMGVMAAPFKALIDVLSKRVKDGWAGTNVLWSSSSFKAYWTQRIVCAIVRETADHKIALMRRLLGVDAAVAEGGGMGLFAFAAGLPPKGSRFEYRVSPRHY
jgi:hypothetical protein